MLKEVKFSDVKVGDVFYIGTKTLTKMDDSSAYQLFVYDHDEPVIIEYEEIFKDLNIGDIFSVDMRKYQKIPYIKDENRISHYNAVNRDTGKLAYWHPNQPIKPISKGN